jgi:hypothetical protein
MAKTIKYLPTDKSMLFGDVNPQEMFFFEDVFWTKHSFSVNGMSGAAALIGYLNEHGTPNRMFNNDTVVFKIETFDE